MGGDLFAIYYEAKTGKVYGLNSSGWTPKGLTIEYLHGKNVDKLDPRGVHAITVPGCVAGWDALRRRFGTKPFSDLLASAAFYAENGFPLPEIGARSWITRALLEKPGYKETYMPGGVRPQLGDVFKIPRSANRPPAAKGRDGYYKGGMAENLVKFRGAGRRPHLEDSRSSSRNGWNRSPPPIAAGRSLNCPQRPGSAALSMLNIMENFPLKDYGHNSAAALHVMIEAKKLAYADMARYVGDPRFGPVPVPEMLSKDLAKRRAGLINMDKASCKVLPSEISQTLDEHGHETIYMSAIDKEGNIVATEQLPGMAPAWSRPAPASRSTIAGRASTCKRGNRTRSQEESAPCTPSSPPSCAKATSPSGSASWADGTSRRLTRSSSPTWSISI